MVRGLILSRNQAISCLNMFGGSAREPLEDICKRVAERFESFDFDEKRLGLEALNVTATVTDVQVEINAVLGVKEPDPRLITTGQTSALRHVCSRRSRWV